MNLELHRMPDLMPLSLKALGSARRKPRPEVELPRMSVSLPQVQFDAGRQAAYREICGFPDSAAVPILYPQVHAIALQMHLLTQPQFPLPLVGLVHLKNHVRQERELGVDENFSVTTALMGHETTERGLEFAIQTDYKDGQGKVAWTSVATVLHRRKQKSSSRKPGSGSAGDGGTLSEYHAIEAPADIGRRYGRISGDMNPIHLYPFTAKLLGFERHIAHGMWSLARCCALLQPQLRTPPHELECQFRNPLFLPARAALRHGSVDGGIAFSLIGRDSGKTHLLGTLR
jgi:hypothetical protein